MPTVKFVLWSGEERPVDVPVGASVMEAAVNNGVPGILGDCGGMGACATCHVYVKEDQFDDLPLPASDELDLLDGVAAPRLASSRIGCQVRVTPALDGLVIYVPDTQI